MKPLMYTLPATEDAFGAAPGNPETLNKIVQQQYDEMNARFAYLREQIGNLAAKHYGPNGQRKLSRYSPSQSTLTRSLTVVQ